VISNGRKVISERTDWGITIKGKLRNNGETLLFEMGIKSEGGLDPKGPHDLKTHTINETEITPPSGKHGADAGTVYFTVNKMNTDNRQNIFLKKSYGIHAESALRECEALHKYVIACKEPFVAVQETRPCRNSTFMIDICTIKEGIQC
jgi:hypothetical protein